MRLNCHHLTTHFSFDRIAAEPSRKSVGSHPRLTNPVIDHRSVGFGRPPAPLVKPKETSPPHPTFPGSTVTARGLEQEPTISAIFTSGAGHMA